jgi:GDSL/SGNH-like Acyl-Esterase family found in Pmr5 and Cas1p
MCFVLFCGIEIWPIKIDDCSKALKDHTPSWLCSGGEWNTGGHCKERKRPLNFTSRKQVPVPELNLILQQVVDQMKTPVTVLNITNLSGLRIDGHPSIYGRKPVTGAQPSGIQDCSHWCLPGVPDAWNELLYYYIVSRQRSIVKRWFFLVLLCRLCSLSSQCKL